MPKTSKPNVKRIAKLIEEVLPPEHHYSPEWLKATLSEKDLRHLFNLLVYIIYLKSETSKKPDKNMQAKLDALVHVVGGWLG